MTTDPSSKREADLLAQLIRQAGRREAPPTGMYEEVLNATRESWQAQLRRKRQQRVTRWAAALAVVGLGGLLAYLQAPGPTAQVAAIARVVGTLETRPAVDMDWQAIGDEGAVLNRGGYVRTLAASRASIVLDNGASLRLDTQTEIALTAGELIELRSGTLYVDTEADGQAGRAVTIITPMGQARDVGTQFEVRYLADNYRLRVREGQVLLQRNGSERLSDAGEQLSIDSTGELATARIAADDPGWRWVQAIAVAPSIDNQPLNLLLNWVSRETGRPLRYAQPALEDKAAMTLLHGNIRNLTPMEALSVVLATTDFTYDDLEDGGIMIRLRSD